VGRQGIETDPSTQKNHQEKVKPKFTQLALLGTLLTLITSKWPRIRYELRYVPNIGKLILALLLGAFVTFALLHALDLLPEFLSIFNIQLL